MAQADSRNRRRLGQRRLLVSMPTGYKSWPRFSKLSPDRSIIHDHEALTRSEGSI